MSLLRSFLKATGVIKGCVDSTEETELRFWLGSDICSVSLGVERVIHIEVRRLGFLHILKDFMTQRCQGYLHAAEASKMDPWNSI